MNESVTPLMRQYHHVKQRFPDTLVLFQVGDFYELFYDDAKRASAFLGIALTKRGKNNGEPIPLCGVPVHALDHYLNKLIRGGFKVALCDQLEPPRPGKVVERGVTRVFTPGTLTETALLDEKNASYIFSFFPTHNAWGLLFGELLTAQLFATVVPASQERILETELNRFFPDEILLPATKEGKSFEPFFKQHGYFTSLVSYNQDEEQVNGVCTWLQQFKPEVRSVVDQQQVLRLALSHLYAYLRTTHESSLQQFNHVQLYQPDDYLVMDAATQRNLELVKNNQDGGRAHTLFTVMDGASTPMGSRTIKKWLLRPLIKQEAIVQRQDVIEHFVKSMALAHQIKGLLHSLGDLERVIGRIALKRSQEHDYLMLAQALSLLPQIKDLLQKYNQLPLIRGLLDYIADFSEVQDLLEKSLNTESNKDWIIKQGFDQKLDRIRELVESGNQKILELERLEQQATGINSLKIRYNQVHGYSIEITKTHYDAIPAHYIRRQTLVGRERFTTEQLQQLEHEIAQAQQEIVAVEQQIFETIKQAVAVHIHALRKTAFALAHIDGLLGFATIAYDHGYVRPHFTAERSIAIKAGRHPVVERTMQTRFIPNDTLLNDEHSLWIITGPNMGGKSTYLRQVALLSIMAQCGSFIPAQQAQLPILDRIFTRIGSGDNLVGGKSTFMVEMEETAAICTQATKQSLVILDEVGRGTSTFDGLALAQAVVEHIYNTVGARCLFATHYHELTNLEQTCPGIVSYYAASTKTAQGIVFLYKMVRGVADGSFGIEVAKLACLPPSIIGRASEILSTLATGQDIYKPAQRDSSTESTARLAREEQIAFEQVMRHLKQIDYDNLSPKQAFDFMWQLRDILPEKGDR